MAKKQKVSVVAGVLTVEYPTIGKVFRADLNKYPESSYRPCQSADHGMKQKFGDAESGKTAAEKYAMVQRIHEALMVGQWELTSTHDYTPLICAAVARIKSGKWDEESGNISLKNKAGKVVMFKPSEAQVKDWGSSLKVKAEIAKMRAEKAAAAAEESDDLDIEV